MQRVVIFGLVALALLLAQVRPLAAQGDGWSLVPIDTVPTEGSNGVGLEFYFTLRDRDGRVVPRDVAAIASSGQLQMRTGPNTAPQPVAVEPATTPISILLLIDTSGSMSSAISTVIAGAQSAVDDAPPNTRFTVAHFSGLDLTQPLPVLETRQSDPEAVKRVLASLATKTGGPTCLYNATYKALEQLQTAQEQAGQRNERRAVILFTDGRDVKDQGSEPCSTRTEVDVVNRAQADRTPIHTVALCNPPKQQGQEPDCSNVDKLVLENLARQSAGFSASGDLAQIEDRFKTIMAGISAQWVVKATVLAAQGENAGTVSVASDARPASLVGDLRFQSSRSYALPPSMTLRDPGYDATKRSWRLNVELANPGGIANLEVSVESGGMTVEGPHTYPVEPTDAPRLDTQLDIPATRLGPGERCFVVRALDAAGAPVVVLAADGQSNGELQMERCVEFTPEVRFGIDEVEARHETGRLVAALSLDGVATTEQPTVKGELLDRDGNQVESFAPLPLEAGAQYVQPLPPQLQERSGQFKLLLTVAVYGQEYQAERQFLNEPPRRPFPWAVVALILVAVGALGMLGAVVYRQRQRPTTLPAPQPIRVVEPVAASPPLRRAPSPADESPLTERLDAPAPVRYRRARIRVIKTKDSAPPPEQIVTSFPWTVGRAGDTVLLGDKNVSRQHLSLSLVNGVIAVIDDSAHGTFIDDKPIEPRKPVPLRGSTRLRLGPYTEIEIQPET